MLKQYEKIESGKLLYFRVAVVYKSVSVCIGVFGFLLYACLRRESFFSYEDKLLEVMVNYWAFKLCTLKYDEVSVLL